MTETLVFWHGMILHYGMSHRPSRSARVLQALRRQNKLREAAQRLKFIQCSLLATESQRALSQAL